MSTSALLTAALEDPSLARWVEGAGTPALDLTAPPGSRPFAVAALARQRPVLVVTATTREADDLVAALGSVMDPAVVATFPSWETLPHERLSPRADTVGRRLAVLRRLRHPEDGGRLDVVVAPVRSVLQPQARGLGDLEPIRLRGGDYYDLDETVERLVGRGYARVGRVERRGEFAVRGGILDIFPPTEEHPLRVEFFGDEVEEVRSFSVADQRSLGSADHGVLAPPCREILLTADVRAKAVTLLAQHPELSEMLTKLADGHPVEGMEALAPVLVDDLVLLIDELPAGAHVVVADPERVRARAADLTRTSQEFLDAAWGAAAFGGKAPIDLGGAAYRQVVEVRDHARAIGLPWWTITPFTADEEIEDDSLSAAAKAAPAYRGDTEAAIADIKSWLGEGWRVVLMTQGHGPGQRLAEMLRDADLGVRLAGPDQLGDPGVLEPGVATVTTGCLTTGWTSELLRLALLTEADLAGARGVASPGDKARMPRRRGRGIDPLQLQPG